MCGMMTYHFLSFHTTSNVVHTDFFCFIPHDHTLQYLFHTILLLFHTMVKFHTVGTICDGQTHPHRPRLVVSHSTCPPLSSSPHAHSFVIGPAVIKHTLFHTIYSRFHTTVCNHTTPSISYRLRGVSYHSIISYQTGWISYQVRWDSHLK